MTTYSVQIQDDRKPTFLFRMIERMMPAYLIIAAMGLMIVVGTFLIGLFGLAPAQADWFADSQAVRESAAAGSSFVDANVTRNELATWVPPLKFLGLGLSLLGINMALGLIAKRLRTMGKVVNAHIPADVRPTTPAVPRRVRVMQLISVMGMMILMVAFIAGLVVAFGWVSSYFDNPVVELNAAQAGSSFLDDLSVINSFNFWLTPLELIGMALLFTGITIALTTITYTLRIQSALLSEFVRKASTR